MRQAGTEVAERPGTVPVSKARLRLWLRLLRGTRRVEAALRDRFRTEFDTTLPRFDVMAALAREPEGMRMSRLSGVLRVSNGNVTGIVDRLAQDGLVVRAAVAGDRRAALVRLTRKGREAFDVQAAAHEGWVSDLLADFDAEEAGRLAARIRATGQDGA